ncbi:MAG: hypothetical protein V1752_02545 [Candidatus Firestonebacteria bacterium]
MMIKKIFAVICFTLIIIQVSYGAFNMINSSARALGMGNAFVAVADDITCLLDNPAGLSNLKSWEATFTATKIAWGIENMGEYFAAAGVPLKGIGGVGAGFYNYSHPLYAENVFYLAYSTPVSLLSKSSFSISGKYLTKSYTANEWTSLNTDFTVLSKSSISVGVSIHSYLSKELSLGLFFDDINSPDVGAFSTEILPATVRLGFNYFTDKNTLISIEGYYRGRDMRILFGGENDSVKTGGGTFLIRIGGGAGTNGYLNVTAGLGYKFNIPYTGIGGQIDYGFQFPLNFVSGSSGNHMVSLTIREKYKEVPNIDTKIEGSNTPVPE